MRVGRGDEGASQSEIIDGAKEWLSCGMLLLGRPNLYFLACSQRSAET